MSSRSLNAPSFDPRPGNRLPHMEVWYLKLNSLAEKSEGGQTSPRSLWLRFSLLVSGNGFKRVAETWAIFNRRNAKKETFKVAIKQTHDIGQFAWEEDRRLRIDTCSLDEQGTRGSVHSKGHTIEWDLAIQPARTLAFDLVPESLRRLGLVRNQARTVGEDLRFTGTSKIDGEEVRWENAPGMQAHFSGPKTPHSWVWSQSNIFVDEKGQAADFVFEGLTARARIAGPVPSPKMSSLFFLYKGQSYEFNTFWECVKIRSKHSLTEWTFQADRGELSFRGRASAEHRDFTGVTYEDTNGSLLYCANSKLSNLEIHVYRRGKLEAGFLSPGAAAFEVVSRQKNPYVPMIL